MSLHSDNHTPNVTLRQKGCDRRVWLACAAAFLSAAPALLDLSPAMAEDASELNEVGMPYEAFDRMPAELLEIGGARVRVAFGPGRFAVSHARIMDYVRQSAHSVARYFGRFPAR